MPAYIRPSHWRRGHFLKAAKLPCLPVQRGPSPVGAWVVLESVRGAASRIKIDADAIVRGSVLLSGVRPYSTARGGTVAKYRTQLRDLVIRFPGLYATRYSRMVHATGSYRVAGSQRKACFESVPLPTCMPTGSAMRG